MDEKIRFGAVMHANVLDAKEWWMFVLPSETIPMSSLLAWYRQGIVFRKHCWRYSREWDWRRNIHCIVNWAGPLTWIWYGPRSLPFLTMIAVWANAKFRVLGKLHEFSTWRTWLDESGAARQSSNRASTLGAVGASSHHMYSGRV